MSNNPPEPTSINEILNKLSMRSIEQHVKDSFTLDRTNRNEAKTALYTLIASKAPKPKQVMLNGKALVHHTWYNNALQDYDNAIKELFND